MILTNLALVLSLMAAAPAHAKENFSDYDNPKPVTSVKLGAYTLKKDDEYNKARPYLLRSGWKPIGGKQISAGEYVDAETRKKYPEAENCSGSGLGYCEMVWQNKLKRVLIINIAGEDGAVITDMWMDK